MQIDPRMALANASPAGNSPQAEEKVPAPRAPDRSGRPVVLVLDDEGLIRWTMRERLREKGYTVLEAETGADALELLRTRHVDLLLLDFQLPDMDGIAVLRRLRSERIPCAAILMTAHETPGLAESAAEYGARQLVPKPFDLDEMVALVDRELALA